MMNFLQKIMATFMPIDKEEINISEKPIKSSMANYHYDIDTKKYVIYDNSSMPKQANTKPKLEQLFEKENATKDVVSDNSSMTKQENTEPNLKPLLEKEYEWCIIGNIVDKHYWGEEKIIRRGTKHFRPNAKVYCFPEYAGIAHESMMAMGQPRKQNRLITITINSKYIKNYRLKKVYQPKIREVIRNHHFYQTHSDEEMHDKQMQRFLEYLNSLTKEIEE